MAEYLEPTSEEVLMAGNSRRLFNAFTQVGFSDQQAFDLTVIWFDRSVEATWKAVD